jgi:translation initiation factor IF-1
MKTFARTAALIALLSLSFALLADAVRFQRIALTLSEEGLILLDAEIDYDLNDTVSEALENGVPLTFETHVQMRRAKAWIWEKDVVEHRLRTVLRYRPLSGLYELRNLQGDEGLSFATRDAALRAMGRIVAMPIIERERLNLDEDYVVLVGVELDLESLPLPMRPLAYVNRDWSISSEPWEWRLRP